MTSVNTPFISVLSSACALSTLWRRCRAWSRKLLHHAVVGVAVAGAGSAAAAEPVVQVAAYPGMATRVLSAEAAPYLLSTGDVDRYQRIFALQQRADWAAADRLIAGLEDDRLLGHVRFQRYMHPTGWRSSFAELRDWLAAYADHPGADRIHRLALTRRGGNPFPRPPEAVSPIFGEVERFGIEPCGSGLGAQARGILNAISGNLRRGVVTRSLEYLERHSRSVPADEYDRLIGRIVRGYFFEQVYDQAAEVGAPAVARSGSEAPMTAWYTGLSQWHLGQFAEAAQSFERLATAACADAWQRAAGGYWAARAHLRRGAVTEVTPWLHVAAAYPRTFYGLIATRVLGVDPPFRFDAVPLDAEALAALYADRRTRRALGLLQIGRHDLAEAEMDRIRFGRSTDPMFRNAVIALVQQANLAEVGLQLGVAYERADGRGYYDGLLYPVGHWLAPSDYAVDRALVHAIMRIESRFDTDSRSDAGATGLMQMMPRTAEYVARTMGARAGPLTDPEVNLGLGQAYLKRMLDDDYVGSNLIHLIVAYNAGPGNLQRWLDEVPYLDDPLLFIESMPGYQARVYVEKVLSGLWIYRHRLGQPSPSLDAIAAGRWPYYQRLDETPTQMVDRGRN